MPDKLTITECTPSSWNVLMIGSLGLILGFGVLYFISGDPLWISIFRFCAFICFVVLVLAYFQTRGRTRNIELEFNDQQLVINYFLSTQKNQEEFFELKMIDQIKSATAPAAWFLIPRKDCIKFTISFTDTKNSLSLFRFQDRDIFVSPNAAQKVNHFLDEHLKNHQTA